MPPAFVLSQDQTLRKINYFIRKSDSKHFNCVVLTTSVMPMSQIEFSRLHRTIQFSISCHSLQVTVIQNITSLQLCQAQIWNIFNFLSAFASVSFRHRRECRNLIYHKNLFCQTKFLKFLSFFISLSCPSEQLRRRKTRHNISSKIFLSNHFEQKMRFFSQKNRPTRKRVGVCMRERGLLDGGGGMRAAEARRLQMDQVDLMDKMDKTGAPLNNPCRYVSIYRS